MGLFSKKPTRPNGRSLRTDKPSNLALADLELAAARYRVRDYPELPLVTTPNISWLDKSRQPPDVCGYVNDPSDEFVIVTCWSDAGGSSISVIPTMVPSSAEPTAMLQVIHEWQAVDPSLQEVGDESESILELKPPRFDQALFEETLEMMGYPIDDEHLILVGRTFAHMTLLKAFEACNIVGVDIDQFRAQHAYSGGSWLRHCQELMDAQCGFDHRLTIYCQQLPWRFKAMMIQWEQEEPGKGLKLGRG